MVIMDWIRKITDIIMPLEPVEEDDDAKDTKKAESKTVDAKAEQIHQESQPAQTATHSEQSEKRAAASAGGFMTGFGNSSTNFTRTGGMVSTSENGVTSMGGVRYEAYTSEASVRPSLAVVKTPQLTMKIYTPTKFDEQVKQIADDLMKRNAVIVNFEGVDDSEQQRIGDFVIGAVYMINGKAEMISQKIVLYVPSGIEYEHASAAISSMRRYN